MKGKLHHVELYEEKHPYAGGPDYYAVYFEDSDRMKVEITGEIK